jgi:hypothetical protein
LGEAPGARLVLAQEIKVVRTAIAHSIGTAKEECVDDEIDADHADKYGQIRRSSVQRVGSSSFAVKPICRDTGGRRLIA